MFAGFKIGSVQVENPLVLAPMEDVSNQPFRLIAKRIGQPGLMFTEFVSAMAIHHGAVKTLRKMQVHLDERPLGIQIFGGEPGPMAETARIAQHMGADILDINMGCWVPKVCRTGAGAALLKDPDLAAEIVRAVVGAVSIPVTVKVRAGWDYSMFAAPDLARRFVDVGAQAITLHARFAKQGFDGQADWDLLRQMREAIHVPLIGNGDVKSPDDAERLLRETGCDGVMVGRAAISNPWVLARIRARLCGEPEPPEPTLTDRIAVAIEHAESMVAFEAGGEREPSSDLELRAVRQLRGQLPLYIKGYSGAAALRERLSRVQSVSEVRELLEEFRRAHSEPAGCDSR